MTWVRAKCLGKLPKLFPKQSEGRGSGTAAFQLITDDLVSTTRMAHTVGGEEALLSHSS